MNQTMVTNGNIVTDNTNRENFLQNVRDRQNTGKPIRKILWPEWDEATSALAHELMLKHIDPDFIYGIPRGGLTLGVQMSHIFKAPLVVEHPRTWNMMDPVGYLGRVCGDGHRPPEVLIVDSIVDTGRTIRELRAKDYLHEYNVHYAVTYCDPKQHSVVDTFWHRKHTNQWLEFPWESIVEAIQPKSKAFARLEK